MKIIQASIKDVLGIVIISLALFFIISGLASKNIVSKQTSKEPINDHSEIINDSIRNERINVFKNLDLIANAAYVYDLKSKSEIFARNIDSQIPIASLTKLMTALVAIENAPINTTLVTINPDALEQDGESGFWLYEQWPLNRLLDITLVGSSNDGAYAVASSITPFLSSEYVETSFIQAMNLRAFELGLMNTSFLSTTGLDINNETSPGAYSSARDITKLFAYIVSHHPEVLEATRLQSITRASQGSREYHIQNTNPLVQSIPLIIGSKTGYTDLAGGNLVVAIDVGLAHPIIITILGSTQEGRFSDMEILIDAVTKYIAYDA